MQMILSLTIAYFLKFAYFLTFERGWVSDEHTTPFGVPWCNTKCIDWKEILEGKIGHNCYWHAKIYEIKSSMSSRIFILDHCREQRSPSFSAKSTFSVALRAFIHKTQERPAHSCPDPFFVWLVVLNKSISSYPTSQVEERPKVNPEWKIKVTNSGKILQGCLEKRIWVLVTGILKLALKAFFPTYDTSMLFARWVLQSKIMIFIRWPSKCCSRRCLKILLAY